jgi:hypothetical protein
LEENKHFLKEEANKEAAEEDLTILVFSLQALHN